MRTLSFQELLIFHEVVECGGITAAAEKLGMAKSAVSKLLNRLEQRLQVTLLTRSARRLSLTPEGQQLLPRVESLLAEGQRLILDARTDTQTPAGTVRIAATPDFGAYVLEKISPIIRKRLPDIKIVFKLALSIEDLQDPTFDLALRIGSIKDDRLVAKPLGQFHRILVGQPHFQNQVQTLNDVTSLNKVIFSSENTERTWTMKDPTGRLHSLPVTGHAAVLSYSVLSQLAAAGEGVALLPRFSVESAIENGRLVNLLPGWVGDSKPVFLAYRFGSQNIQRIAAVMEVLKEEVPQHLDAVDTID